MPDNLPENAFQRSRLRVARWLSMGAVAFLVVAAAAFVQMWLQAYMEGAITEIWGKWDSNHGPWRHRYTLRAAWWLILHCQVLSFGLASLSFLLSPSRKAGFTALVTAALGLGFIYSLYWLVD